MYLHPRIPFPLGYSRTTGRPFESARGMCLVPDLTGFLFHILGLASLPGKLRLSNYVDVPNFHLNVYPSTQPRCTKSLSAQLVERVVQSCRKNDKVDGSTRLEGILRRRGTYVCNHPGFALGHTCTVGQNLIPPRSCSNTMSQEQYHIHIGLFSI